MPKMVDVVPRMFPGVFVDLVFQAFGIIRSYHSRTHNLNQTLLFLRWLYVAKSWKKFTLIVSSTFVALISLLEWVILRIYINLLVRNWQKVVLNLLGLVLLLRGWRLLLELAITFNVFLCFFLFFIEEIFTLYPSTTPFL